MHTVDYVELPLRTLTGSICPWLTEIPVTTVSCWVVASRSDAVPAPGLIDQVRGVGPDDLAQRSRQMSVQLRGDRGEGCGGRREGPGEFTAHARPLGAVRAGSADAESGDAGPPWSLSAGPVAGFEEQAYAAAGPVHPAARLVHVQGAGQPVAPHREDHFDDAGDTDGSLDMADQDRSYSIVRERLTYVPESGHVDLP